MTNNTLTTTTNENKAAALFGIVEKLSVAKNADPQKISELLSIWERLNATQAKADFEAAISAVKPQLPVIVKNNEVFLGANRGYQYEDLASIAAAIDPILARHGLSYRFHTSSTIDTVTVTCRLSHVSGHYEETSLTSGLDKGPSRNLLQSLGSSVTYLSRYTLKSSLGLAASKDTDGRVVDDAADAQTDTIKPEQVLVLRALLKKSGRSEDRLCKHYNVNKLEDLLVGNFAQAQQVLSRHVNGEVTQ